METVFKFIIVFICCTYGYSNIKVDYLRGVPRLGNISYWDYYFSCYSEGQTLQWEVNGDPLGGFNIGDVGRVIFSIKPTYDFTATLLSSREISAESHNFDSVLIISVRGPANLEVTCRNGSLFNSTYNEENRTDTVNLSTTDFVSLQFLLIKNIIRDDSLRTSILICGVRDILLFWKSDSIFTFSTLNFVGQDQFILRQDGTTVKQQAIFLAQEPYQIISVLFVTTSLNINVSCSGTETDQKITIMVPAIYNTNSATSSTETSIATNSTLPNYQVVKIVAIIFGLFGGVLLIVFIIVTIIVFVKIYNRKAHPKLEKKRNEVAEYTRMKSKDSGSENELPREKIDSQVVEEPRQIDKDGSICEFCDRVQYIIFISNDIEFKAARLHITGPDIVTDCEVILHIDKNTYIGNIGDHPVGVIQDKTLENCVGVVTNAITQHFTNAEYIINVGGIRATDHTIAKLADVLISKAIVHISGENRQFYTFKIDVKPEIRKIFCPDSHNEGLEVTTNRKAKHKEVQIAGGVKLLDDKYLQRLAQVYRETHGFEKACGELVKLQENGIDMSDHKKYVQIICINGVTGYINNEIYPTWKFIAHKAAFHYVEYKLKSQPVKYPKVVVQPRHEEKLAADC